jgi:hydroxylamine reductase
MYCNQCEQTSKGLACTVVGVCGKKPGAAALQDLILHSLQGLSKYAQAARSQGIEISQEINQFTMEALFTTLTNVNFDPESLKDYIHQAVKYQNDLQQAGAKMDEPVLKITGQTTEELVEEGERAGYLVDLTQPEDIRSLQEILVHGLKGVAAYAHHAEVLGKTDERIYAFAHEALAVINDRSKDLNFWLDMVLKCGEINLITIELLDAANTGAYGHPVPTSVPLGHKKGKAILVSGHDLHDLKGLLEATQGTGINIYTHGEMLPAHGYPELKKYPHLVGHYGTAWQNQRREFPEFPGPILMTTNCIQEPKETYKENIFTTGPVAWPGVTHLPNGQWEWLIEKAMAMPGFVDDVEAGSVMVGFGHHTVIGIADTVIEAVKSGDIRHFLLVGGCDGAKPGRSYYTEIVDQAPNDTVVLTLGCGKYRFFDHNLGQIGEIPRLLDCGQCNDAFSAVKIALALADAFECSVNDLPLSLVLSWYEQKAVSILLSLLHLGIKNIRLGPTLPAFISPGVLNVLVENFGIKPITTAEQDLKAILQ